jgi:hypothetical protein
VGDRVFYVSVKGKYGITYGKAVVAALEVDRVFPNHVPAARWYKRQGCPLPSSCMVRRNEPVAVPLTRGLPKNADESGRLWSKPVNGPPTLKAWDAEYWLPAKIYPSFVVTKLLRPPAIDAPLN